MSRRYLYGPVLAEYADQNLYSLRQQGQCLAFNQSGTADLALGPTETWDDVCARLPSGWRPDFVVLNLPYQFVPSGLWDASVPLVGLAADWNLLWHGFRHYLRCCDLVLTDTAGAEVMAREGIEHARVANLFGCGRAFLGLSLPERELDIDVLFVGNLNPAVQRERLPWLARLARLADRWRVVIQTGVYGDAYRELLMRARIVFNRSIRQECNQRAFEATALGALLFQEENNREVSRYYRDRQECVYYNEHNLEELLTYYLEHEDERRALAEAGQARAREFGFDSLWSQALEVIDREWSALKDRARARIRRADQDPLPARVWQALSSIEADLTLPDDLAAAAARHARPAALHNALGMVSARAELGGAARSAEHFRRAAEADPTLVLPALNLAETLACAGLPEAAAGHAQRALDLLDRLPTLAPGDLDGGHFPPAFDQFRVEWERAAWGHAGRRDGEARAKRALLSWRLHALLTELTGDLAHGYEAVLAHPDLPTTRASLGAALLKAGKPAEAIPHLREAVAGVPFDRESAGRLFQALGAAGDAVTQLRLAHDRRLLAAAAPELVPAEPWFMDVPSPDNFLTSIIILCCNEVEYTRLCLDSVFRHTRPPYELVLVDNGSADGTAAYLDSLRVRPGPVRMEVIRNATNRGFPAGCNQALARARGDYLLFLNNDTIVTPGWLDGLLAWIAPSQPEVGLVGAVSNYTAPPQQVPADYGTSAVWRRSPPGGSKSSPARACAWTGSPASACSPPGRYSSASAASTSASAWASSTTTIYRCEPAMRASTLSWRSRCSSIISAAGPFLAWV